MTHKNYSKVLFLLTFLTLFSVNYSSFCYNRDQRFLDSEEHENPKTSLAITITSPSSGDVWKAGTTQTIFYEKDVTYAILAHIYLYKGGSEIYKISSQFGGLWGIEWTIPNDLVYGTDYQIYIYASGAEDFSDYFTITETETITVIEPTSTSRWEMGDQKTILWTSTGSVSHVRIELYKDNLYVQNIALSVLGSYMWAIPTHLDESNNYQIKIIDTSDSSVFDYSDYFEVYSNPSVMDVSSTKANGIYRDGENIPITIEFSEPVVVTGTPQLTLETGSLDAIIDFTSGSGTQTLIFNYIVGPEHNSGDLEYFSNTALTLNGGIIKDGAGNDAVLTLPAPGASSSLSFNKDIVIDTTTPKIVTVSSTKANGIYGDGENIPITIEFSEPVVVTGTPQLTLETGSLDAIIDFTSGSGTQTLIFNYIVGPEHNSGDLEYFSNTALTLNSGIIKDGAGNDAVLTLPAPGASGSLSFNKDIVIVDITNPIILNITSTIPNGIYSAGETIPIIITFSEAVIVTGIPQLILETGSPDAMINYFSGSETDSLTFIYIVDLAHNSPDLKCFSNTALTLNGGTIKDGVGNNANLLLITPGEQGSLSANKDIVIDNTTPTGSVIINNQDEYTTSTLVSLSLSAQDVNGIAEMRFSNDNVIWSNWESYVTIKNYTLQGGDGLKSVYVQYKDSAELISEGIIIDTIILDITTPTGSVIINNQDEYTTSALVSLSLSAQDVSGIAEMRFSNDNIIWSNWESYVTIKNYTLQGGDGLKNVYVQYKDSAELISEGIIIDTIILDITTPTGSVIINNQDEYTTSTLVSLSLSAQDVNGIVEMRFSNDNIIWSNWESYVTIKDYTLQGGDGLKSVYVQYKDSAELISEGIIIDTIILNTAAPTGSVTINNQDEYTTSTLVSLSLSAQDVNGIAEMRFSNDNIIWSNWESYVTIKNYTLQGGDGLKSVFVQYKNSAGLISEGIIKDTIILDTTAPNGTIEINNGDLYTHSTNVSLIINGIDTNSVIEIRFSLDGLYWTEWELYTLLKNYTIPDGDRIIWIFIQFKDSANLVSPNTIRDSIILDTTNPTGSVLINNGDEYTSSTLVTLTIDAIDINGVIEMRFSNDSNNWSEWESYANFTYFILSSGEENKIIYIQFKDMSGLISNTLIYDEIMLISSDSESIDGDINFIIIISAASLGGVVILIIIAKKRLQ